MKNFGKNLFTKDIMKKYLSDDTIQQLFQAPIGQPLDIHLAEQISIALRTWARENNIFYYGYWYHPIQGVSSHKKISFYETAHHQDPILNFSGEQLTVKELEFQQKNSTTNRNTFEARGYIFWDHTCPPFIIQDTMFIPAVFVGYNGASLDYKSLILKSIQALNNSALKVCQYFDKEIQYVHPKLGWEQEFYLLEKSIYMQHKDLQILGKCITNTTNIDQHQNFNLFENNTYFNFFQQLEQECLHVGILLKAKHKEEGPFQYECASSAEHLNISIDHNLLFKEIVKHVASKFDLIPLFVEKPFPEFPGSSNHLNWSLVSDKGKNLLSPGLTPRNNIRFLTFFVNVLRAMVSNQHPLYYSSITYGNLERLGKSGAPGELFQIYIGPFLENILLDIEQKIENMTMNEEEKSDLKTNFSKIPETLLDNTDHARVAPLAFTGNKFELRLPGASVNPSKVMLIFHALISKQFEEYEKDMQKLILAGQKKDEAIFTMLKKYIQEIKKNKNALIFKSKTEIPQNNSNKMLQTYSTSPDISCLEDLEIMKSFEIEYFIQNSQDLFLQEIKKDVSNHLHLLKNSMISDQQNKKIVQEIQHFMILIKNSNTQVEIEDIKTKVQELLNSNMSFIHQYLSNKI